MAHHIISHVEIPVNDPRTSREFYSDLFGWKITVDETYNYSMFQPESGPMGGFVQVRENPDSFGQLPGEVLIYVSTDDIDASMEKVRELGGEITFAKTEVPGTGWLAVFTDPNGNSIGLFQYS